MIDKCKSCRKYFYNSSLYQQCWICFKKSKGWDLTKGDVVLQANIEELDSLYRENQRLKRNPPQRVTKKIVSFDDLAKSKVKRLLKLCHPDRHTLKMKPIAQNMTTWLINLKKKVDSDRKRP